ncbi:SpaH/EbpB family LPXTG-anchored major pilin [Microbacterium sp. NPDC089190]|uniref:SpaH/EbpB family LPXTG-anchored major pilin n=1 Tax=Microbacterium sp. NPDC089190 TaxID=3155063 RepID=UPI00344DF41E
MTTTRFSRRLRLLASAGVAAALLAAAAPAHASSADIDTSASVSLTIHKFEQPATGTLGTNDGTKIANPGGTPLADVEFTVQKVTDVDLTTDTGWATASALTVADVYGSTATHTLGTGIVRTTDSAGEITLTSPAVGIGLYLVRETAPGTSSVVSPAVPFLVALPQPANGAWNYDVHVYPKNAVSRLTKTVDESKAHVIGDTLPWTITNDVSKAPAGTSISSYEISDTLESRLGYSSTTVSLVDGSTTSTLATPRDYTLTAPTVGTSGDVVVSLTASGLAKLNGVASTAKVIVEIDTTVLSIGDGTISNTATAYINDPQHTHGTSSTPTPSTWGALRVVKHVTGDSTKTLAGAVFDVYAVDPSTAGATAVVTGATTGANGSVQVAGLRTGDYWLVETTAPTGYQKLAQPVKITVAVGSTTSPNVADIADSPIPPFTLPLTGGSTGAAFTAAGGALVVLALGVVLVRRARRRA